MQPLRQSIQLQGAICNQRRALVDGGNTLVEGGYLCLSALARSIQVTSNSLPTAAAKLLGCAQFVLLPCSHEFASQSMNVNQIIEFAGQIGAKAAAASTKTTAPLKFSLRVCRRFSSKCSSALNLCRCAATRRNLFGRAKLSDYFIGRKRGDQLTRSSLGRTSQGCFNIRRHLHTHRKERERKREGLSSF